MSKLLLRLLALCLFLPSPTVWSEPAENLTILSSIRPLTLLATDLLEGLPVEIKTLLPASADPHNWAMRVSDRQVLATADLVVWLGPDFENFLAKPLRERPDAQLELGALPGLRWPQASGHDHHHHDHHHGGRDMHLWLNPANAIELQTALAAKIAEQKPQWRAELQQRLQRQTAQLSQLQDDIQRRLASHQQTGFIAYHDAYGHFVDAFGLHQLAAVNQSAEQRLSAKALHQLQAQARNARCLLAEKNGNQERRLAERLGLPLIVADGLALDPQLQTFTDFLTQITTAFEACASFVAE
jgi:zinc transport system substrate-binding protein